MNTIAHFTAQYHRRLAESAELHAGGVVQPGADPATLEAFHAKVLAYVARRLNRCERVTFRGAEIETPEQLDQLLQAERNVAPGNS